MCFAEEFTSRWRDVIEPTVQGIAFNDVPLRAYRVDASTVSDSILTEILAGIAHSRLIIADISTIGLIDGKPIRNANVFYEVGLAQAVRLPQEVLLFRSDNDPLLFDTANIRVNSYEPEKKPQVASKIIVNAVVSALKEIELKKSLALQRIAETLDVHSWTTLLLTIGSKEIFHPDQKTMGQMLGSFPQSLAINRLLEIGALRIKYPKLTLESCVSSSNIDMKSLLPYEGTEFGRALLLHTVDKLGVTQPDIVKHLMKIFENDSNI
ncbi:MAG: hypothetical protein AABY45_00015 [Deltaproteobacteria bacterium]